MRSCHHVVARISRRQDHEVFQSSRMSWSSNIIAEGSVESAQRTTSSLHASRYSSAYSTKSLISSPGGCARSRREAMNSSSSGCGVVSAYTWSPSSRSRSGQAAAGSSRRAIATDRRASTPWSRLPTSSWLPVVRHVPKANRGSRVGSRVRIRLGGIPGSGHTGTPSSWTS